MKTVLETRRLLLREMTRDDADFVAMMLADPMVMRHYKKCYSRDEADQWLQRQLDRYAEDGHGLWLVVDKQSREPIGQVGLCRRYLDDRREDEIGYLIHHPYWKQGFASEAARGVRDYAFTELKRDRVISLIRPANVPSQRVALSIGMKPTLLTTFAELDHLMFAVAAD